MKHLSLVIIFLCASLASAATEIKRLSPVFGSSKIPSQCQLVSILPGSPAEKAGLQVGDIIRSVNGQVPADASTLSDLVSAAPEDSNFDILKKDGPTQNVKIRLNSVRPRLGSICDLAGWEKSGVTAAGNESVTVFEGPFSLTVSGIIDKEILFLRVRVSNNQNKPLEIGPPIFTASIGEGLPLAILSPKEVICFLSGDKGAHLLALKKKKHETLDAHESVPGMAPNADEHCEGGAKGRLDSSDPKYAEANAQYLATESLWPQLYQPGAVADGLIYMKQPSLLPVTIQASLDGHTLKAQLGKTQASVKQMKRSELIAFFQAQKKGNSLRLTLKKGKVFVGKFSNFDDVEERVWFNTPSGGMLNSTSYSVENINFAEPLEQIPTKPTPGSNELN